MDTCTDCLEGRYKEYWERAAAFHGHVCGGLAIGFKAAVYAIELLEVTFSQDEEVVCIAENDACGVDAIQSVLGCSIGKGNLLFHMTGKQAFSFYNRKTGKAGRLYLKARAPEGLKREDSCRFYLTCGFEDMYAVSEPKTAVPERARLFKSIPCARCGEITAESMVRVEDGKMVCPDCFGRYDRFAV